MIGIFKFKKPDLDIRYNENKLVFKVEIDQESNTAIKQIINDLDPDTVYTATIDKIKHKRTLDQNAYLWVLCDRIASVLKSDKVSIYQNFVERVGVFTVLCLQDKVLDDYTRRWQQNGIGWFCKTEPSKLPKCTTVYAYYGSSSYSTEEMARLLEEVIHDCKELNIPTEVMGYDEERWKNNVQ